MDVDLMKVETQSYAKGVNDREYLLAS